MRNRLIAKLRSPGERPFEAIKKVFKAVYTVQRGQVKMIFSSFAVNFYHPCTIDSAGII
jgi:hypothetical protein